MGSDEGLEGSGGRGDVSFIGGYGVSGVDSGRESGAEGDADSEHIGIGFELMFSFIEANADRQ